MDSMVSETELMKQAEHCGLDCTPTLNQTGELKAHFLLDEQVGQFVAEGIARVVVGEIAAVLAPADDGVDDAADELAHGVLALGSVGLAVKIFADDDIGGGLRPILGDLDTFLAEDGHALFVADRGSALFPFHGVEGRDFSIRKEAFEYQAGPGSSRILGAHPVV